MFLVAIHGLEPRFEVNILQLFKPEVVLGLFRPLKISQMGNKRQHSVRHQDVLLDFHMMEPIGWNSVLVSFNANHIVTEIPIILLILVVLLGVEN
jgi:hypothetical protein